jgi:DNA polymerase I-like protein with 3'-5' exonuclease and polymerase domains
MNAMADIAEKIKKLKTKIDADGRIRTTYNIAGTNTGRFPPRSSSRAQAAIYRTSKKRCARIFIADPGMKWCKLDAKQIQSRIVGGH